MKTRECRVWGLAVMMSGVIAVNTASQQPSLGLQRTAQSVQSGHPRSERMATGDGHGSRTMDGHDSTVANVSVFVWGGTPGGVATAVIAAEAMARDSEGKIYK